jgi:SAM-dependent methyltransferase
MRSFFVPKRRFDPSIQEMMDRPNADPEVLRDDLENLRTINRYFGGLAAVRKAITPLLLKMDEQRTVEILDLATGSADQPLALLGLARTLGRRVRIVAIDKNPEMLQVARERTSEIDEISIQEGDIRSPQFPPKHFDIVLCSLAIHHFSREDAIQILRNMARLSRVGFIVNDLRRSWLGAGAAWLYAHMTTRNPMTRYDSPLSVLRAFTPDELSAMAVLAGISHFQILRHPMFRLVLVATHADGQTP